MKDSQKSILSSARWFSFGTMLSRVTGMARDVSIAYCFGSDPSVASLMMAMRFAQFFRRFLGEGALQSAFVPHLEHLRGESEDKARAFFRDLRLSLVSVLTGLVFVCAGALLCFLRTSDLEQGTSEVLGLTLILSPLIFFTCLWGLNVGLLQAQKHYFLAGISPAFFNVACLVGTWALWDWSTSEAMPYLAGALVVGSAVTCLFSYPATLRWLGRGGRGKLFSSEVRRLIPPLLLGMLGVGATQINSLCDVIFARWADPSGPAFLWYAIRFEQLPLAVFGIALSGALLPPLSRASRDGDWVRYASFLRDGIRRSFQLMGACSLFLVVGGPVLVGALYGRGDFDAAATAKTLLCLMGYAVGLVPSTWVLLLGPAFYARKEYRIPTLLSLSAVGANLGLSYVFIFLWGWGPWSVAVTTSLSSFLNFFGLAWAFRRETGLSIWRPIGGSLLWSGLGALGGAGLTHWVAIRYFPASSLTPLWDGSWAFERDLSGQFLALGILMAVFFLGVAFWESVGIRRREQREATSS